MGPVINAADFTDAAVLVDHEQQCVTINGSRLT
jgi:hypothetical protein